MEQARIALEDPDRNPDNDWDNIILVMQSFHAYRALCKGKDGQDG